jgi:hypothetical protein
MHARIGTVGCSNPARARATPADSHRPPQWPALAGNPWMPPIPEYA